MNPFRQRPARVVDIKGGHDPRSSSPAAGHRYGQSGQHPYAPGRSSATLKVEPKVAQRVVDFITGAAYALMVRYRRCPTPSSSYRAAPLQGTSETESTIDYLRRQGDLRAIPGFAETRATGTKTENFS